MLNFRLCELNDVVDKFLIVEGKYTFKGDEKPLKFNIANFKKFADKIIYKSCDILPTSNPWLNERNQRDFLKENFRNITVKTNDIVLLSDVDEIPDINVLKEFKTSGYNGMSTFYHNFYYYNVKCRNISKWPGTVVIDAHSFKKYFNFSFEYLRNNRHSLKLIGKANDYTSGGWHFSYFGDVNYIINKIKSFSHQEYNNELYTNPETIKKLIEDGKDLFFRDTEQYEILEKQDYLPTNINLLL